MNIRTQYQKTYWITGILGLSSIIIFHEMGHFLACKLFHVGTPLFSLGFGPRLYAFTIKSTTFQLAVLPLGGYVSIDPTDLAAQSYTKKMIITSAGILFNFLFSWIAFIYLMYGTTPNHEQEYTKHTKTKQDTVTPEDYSEHPVNRLTRLTRLKNLQKKASTLLAQQGSKTGIIGPIGIMALTGKSLAYGVDLFIFVLAWLSMNIGMFNILPIPGLDGSQLLALTLEKVAGPLTATGQEWIQLIIFILFALLMFFIITRNTKKAYKEEE